MRLRTALLLLIMLICYTIPWVINPGVSLTLGGYDLAEWTSLHFAVRAEMPMLLTSFLLRLPLALLALISGSSSPRTAISAILILLLAAAVLPPLEFLDAPGDPNYLQQIMIALIALIGGFIGWSGYFSRWQQPILIALGMIGAAAVVIGTLNTHALMRGFALPTEFGAGAILMSVMFAVNVFAARNAKSARSASF